MTKDKSGEFQNIATWFKVTLWGNQAETASKYLSKGRPIYIEGRLRIEEWTDRDGNNRQSLEVNATDMQFLGGSDRGEGGGEYSGGGASQPDDRDSGFTGAPQTTNDSSSSSSAPAVAPVAPDELLARVAPVAPVAPGVGLGTGPVVFA